MSNIDYNEIPDDDVAMYVTPDECRAWANKIRENKKHAFWGGQFGGGTPSLEESSRAVKFVNLMDQGWETKEGCNIANWVSAHEAESEQDLKDISGTSNPQGGGKSSAHGKRYSDNDANTYADVGFGEKKVNSKAGTYKFEGGERVDVDPEDDAGLL